MLHPNYSKLDIGFIRGMQKHYNVHPFYPNYPKRSLRFIRTIQILYRLYPCYLKALECLSAQCKMSKRCLIIIRTPPNLIKALTNLIKRGLGIIRIIQTRSTFYPRNPNFIQALSMQSEIIRMVIRFIRTGSTLYPNYENWMQVLSTLSENLKCLTALSELCKRSLCFIRTINIIFRIYPPKLQSLLCLSALSELFKRDLNSIRNIRT